MWFWYAVLSAVFAALTSILAKAGIEGVNSNLATAIRTVVVVVMAWGMVFDQYAGRNRGNQQKKLDIPDLVRACHGSFMALLLQGAAAGGRLEGGAHR